MRTLLLKVMILFLGQGILAQNPTFLIEKINNAINSMDNIHFKTEYISKYYTDDDTSFAACETWLTKNIHDTILGMDIRCVGHYAYGEIETLHINTTTWQINHDKDTIVKYDQASGQWDGFTGNWQTEWTTESPIVTGIRHNADDSLLFHKTVNGNFIITRISPDDLEYGIRNITKSWWIESNTMLPFRVESSWEIEGRQTYNNLITKLLDTSHKRVKQKINQKLPDYVCIEYKEPDRSKYKPLDVGDSIPKLIGHFIQDSNSFNLQSYADTSLVLIDFWYQSCGPCIRAIPYLDSLQSEFKARGLKIFSVNSRDHQTNQEDLIKFIVNRGGSLENFVMTDFKTERVLWKCYVTPTFYLIKEGKVIWVKQGFLPKSMEDFRIAIINNISI